MPQTTHEWNLLKDYYLLARIRDGRAKHDTLTQEKASEIISGLIKKSTDAQLETIADRLALVTFNRDDDPTIDLTKVYADQLSDLKRQRNQLKEAQPPKTLKKRH